MAPEGRGVDQPEEEVLNEKESEEGGESPNSGSDGNGDEESSSSDSSDVTVSDPKIAKKAVKLIASLFKKKQKRSKGH